MVAAGREGRHDAPIVSVVIAAFDAEGWIARAIGSVRERAGFAIEIVVVDDASRDLTVQVVDELRARDPRIRLDRLVRNAGPAAARNRAIALARGRWVAVLDADDAYLPGRLERLVANAESAGAVIVADNFANVLPGDVTPPCPALHDTPARDLLQLHDFLRGARPDTAEADFGLLKPLFRADFLRRHALRYPEGVRHGEDVELIIAALGCPGATYLLCRDQLGYLYSARAAGNSRTRIDYRHQISRSRALARAAGARGDREAARLLHARGDALCRFDLNAFSYGGGRSPYAPTVILRALCSAAGRAWLLERATRRVR